MFGCNDVHSLLLISQKATDKKVLFQKCQFSFFTKRIKMNDNFFFQINNHWKPMTAIYNWDYDIFRIRLSKRDSDDFDSSQYVKSLLYHFNLLLHSQVLHP